MEKTKRIKWTDEMILADAKRFSTRSEWKRKSKSAYHAALRLCVIDAACAHMDQVYTAWTDDMVIADAKRFSTRSTWQRKSKNAYQVALRRGLLNAACAHMDQVYTAWTDEMIIADAAKYSTRSTWQRKSRGAHAVARRRGLLNAACAHMVVKRKDWTFDSLKAEAEKYSTRIEFERGSDSAVVIARRRGFYEEICRHMGPSRGMDNDAIYIWRAAGWVFNGNPVYKVGVTSARLDDIRIQQVAKAADATAEIVIIANVKSSATKVEKDLLKIGDDPKYIDFDGCTEFRAMSDEQLQQALDIIRKEQV